MPFNGSGVFQRVRNWVADATAGVKIRADYHDDEDNGFAAGLTNCIAKDGQTVVTQNIPFNSKRITGLADPVNPQDASTKAYADTKLAVTGGAVTANPIFLNATNYYTTDGTNNIIRSDGATVIQRSSDGFTWATFNISGLTMAYGGISTPGSVTASGINGTTVAAGAGGFTTGSPSTFAGITTGSIDASSLRAPIQYLNGTNVTLTDGTNYYIRSGGAVYFHDASGTYEYGHISNTELYHATFIRSGGAIRSDVGRITSYRTSDSPSVGCYNTARGYDCGMWMTDRLYFGQMSTSDIGAPLEAWMDVFGTLFRVMQDAQKPGGGAWAATSDERIKTVLGDYTSGLEAVAALQPVRFTYKGNDTTEPPSNSALGVAADIKADAKNVPTAPYPNSFHYSVAAAGREFIGLVAQQAEATMPELVTTAEGFIDGVAVTDLRNIDTTPLLFALINAVKELKAEIDTLKGAR